MKIEAMFRTGVALATILLAAGCASVPDKSAGSGFLPDYSKLQEQDVPGGKGKRLAYVNPVFTPQRYNALILEPLQYYPEPKPNEYVNTQILDQIRDYANQSLRQKVGEKMRLVDQPGPGVARLRVAITAAGADTEALKAYQYIPIGLAITGAMAAVEGGRPKQATIAIEAEADDSLTKEVLFMVMRGGEGERVKSEKDGQHKVTLDELKPLIDDWTAGAAQQLTTYIKAK